MEEDIAKESNTEKELKGQINKTNAILSLMNEGLIAFSGDKKVVIINQAASILLRRAGGDVVGKEIHQVLNLYKGGSVVGEKDSPITKAIIHGAYSSSISDDYYLEDKNGKKIPIVISGAVLIEGGEIEDIKGVVMFKDITAEKEVDKAKSEFVSLASHQLRTPLSSINWYTEMLLALDVGPLNEDQKKYLKEIYIGSKRMDSLVDTFLDVSRLELGTFVIESEPTDVPAIIKSVLDELKLEIDEKQLVLKESYGESISPFLADQRLLRIIFQNLLSNAMKYTPKEGVVTVTVVATPKGQNFGGKEAIEDSFSISVGDSGIGIPTDQKDKIFTKLFRADNAKESQAEGTGLGLYILKSIVSQSGGLIWFNSEEGKGTTFFVVFPAGGMKGKEI